MLLGHKTTNKLSSDYVVVRCMKKWMCLLILIEYIIRSNGRENVCVRAVGWRVDPLLVLPTPPQANQPIYAHSHTGMRVHSLYLDHAPGHVTWQPTYIQLRPCASTPTHQSSRPFAAIKGGRPCASCQYKTCAEDNCVRFIHPFKIWNKFIYTVRPL